MIDSFRLEIVIASPSFASFFFTILYSPLINYTFTQRNGTQCVLHTVRLRMNRWKALKSSFHEFRAIWANMIYHAFSAIYFAVKFFLISFKSRRPLSKASAGKRLFKPPGSSKRITWRFQIKGCFTNVTITYHILLLELPCWLVKTYRKMGWKVVFWGY